MTDEAPIREPITKADVRKMLKAIGREDVHPWQIELMVQLLNSRGPLDVELWRRG